jgi:hypothetical protein
MKDADYFDWSCLDRYTVAALISSARDSFVNNSLTTTEFSKKIKQVFYSFNIPVRIVSSYSKKTNLNTAWVGGFYESYKDQAGENSIAIKLQYNSSNTTITIKNKEFKRLSLSIADTLMHEIIHMRQYRRRNFKSLPGYASFAESKRKQIDQEYLGHKDEIDAYSFNIACQLFDRFGGDQKKIIQHLDINLSDRRRKKDLLKMYLEAFDYDHRHPVVMQLKKRIVRYLPNVQEGKPYKTSEWLKNEKNKNKN